MVPSLCTLAEPTAYQTLDCLAQASAGPNIIVFCTRVRLSTNSKLDG